MAARDQEREEWKLRAARREKGGQEMPFEVVDPSGRDAQRSGKAMGERSAH
jgi:hypothetical protein